MPMTFVTAITKAGEEQKIGHDKGEHKVGREQEDLR